ARISKLETNSNNQKVKVAKRFVGLPKSVFGNCALVIVSAFGFRASNLRGLCLSASEIAVPAETNSAIPGPVALPTRPRCVLLPRPPDTEGRHTISILFPPTHRVESAHVPSLLRGFRYPAKSSEEVSQAI